MITCYKKQSMKYAAPSSRFLDRGLKVLPSRDNSVDSNELSTPMIPLPGLTVAVVVADDVDAEAWTPVVGLLLVPFGLLPSLLLPSLLLDCWFAFEDEESPFLEPVVSEPVRPLEDPAFEA